MIKNIFNILTKSKNSDSDKASKAQAAGQAEDPSRKAFFETTAQIRSLLDSGAKFLKNAENESDKIITFKVDSKEYNEVVAKVKLFQSKAREDFTKAEELMKIADSLLAKSKK